jgi:hypothetical protein
MIQGLQNWKDKTDAKYKLLLSRNIDLGDCMEPHSSDWIAVSDLRPIDAVIELSKQVPQDLKEDALVMCLEEHVPWETSDKWTGDELITLFD